MWTLFYMLSHFSHVRLLAALWTVVLQSPLSMGLSRQEYWSGLPFPSPGDLPNPGIEPTFLMSGIGRQVCFHWRHLGSFSFMGGRELSSGVT